MKIIWRKAVYVEGRLNLNKWEDSNGEPRSRLEVVANNVQFLSSPGSRPDSGSKASVDNDEVPDFDDEKKDVEAADEEIPF